MIDYLIIGHVTKDVTPDGFRLGGTVTYAYDKAGAEGRLWMVTDPAGVTDLTYDERGRVRREMREETHLEVEVDVGCDPPDQAKHLLGPFDVTMLGIGAIIGAMVGFPALRLTGIYLVIATISFALIVEEVLARWESVTNGNEGMRVKTLSLFGTAVSRDSPTFYFLCLAVLVLTIVGTLNLLRSPTGRAFVAIRDSETAARSMGVNVALYKVKSFAISAAITGFAGVLFAHKLCFISPEMFTLQLSIEFIIVILIGGTFSLHGAVLGAIFLVMIDPFLTYLKDDMPGIIAGVAATLGAGKERAAHIQDDVAAFASLNGLKGAIYGIIIVLFVLFEPLGLYGRWLKIKLFFQLFPLYKRATFKRQKIYVKSERNR